MKTSFVDSHNLGACSLASKVSQGLEAATLISCLPGALADLADITARVQEIEKKDVFFPYKRDKRGRAKDKDERCAGR